MLNRVIQLKLVKRSKHENAAPSQTDTNLEGKAAIIGHYLADSIDKIGGVVLTYIILDTIRQMLVAKAQK